MRLAIKVLKGLVIGIAVVMPGVSGGTLALSMGIYNQLIDLASISQSLKKSLVRLMPYLLGIVLGMALFAYVIEILFDAYPLPTTFLFVGLILGGIPMLARSAGILQKEGKPAADTQKKRFRLTHAILFFGTAALVVLLTISGQGTGASLLLKPELSYAPLLFGLGLIIAATLVIPGISGSMIMMLLGYYEPLLHGANSFTTALVRLDFGSALTALGILGPFAIGVAIGIVAMARVVRALLKRFPHSTYYAILGLVVSSVFAVLYEQSFAGASALTYAVCALMAGAGFLTAMALDKGEA